MIRFVRYAIVSNLVSIRGGLFVLLAVVLAVPAGYAQLIRGGAVGGVQIDVEGVVSNPTPVDLREVQAAWQADLEEIPDDLDSQTDLRFVSLRGLEAAIADSRKRLEPLPDAVLFLAGLQRVRFVLVDPKGHDVILAGPAEGWQIDALGNTVGATSRRPVLLLDDLMAALRAARTDPGGVISCSIDPTSSGLKRVQQVSRGLRAGMSPQMAARQIEEALGEQIVSIDGVPDTSHFARVLVAADFRMKRLAMNFEPAPVSRMPSYLELASTGRRGAKNLLPRWWLAPHYESLRRDPSGLVWEIRGQGVKCLTEDDVVSADGQRRHTGSADPVAQKWADAFTARFEELAHEDSAFGQLRNAMDLAVVGALVEKESLIRRADLEIPRLMGDEMLERFNAPRRVASQASLVKKRGGWLISASGGVQIQPLQVAGQAEVSSDLASTVSTTAHDRTGQWWWNGQ